MANILNFVLKSLMSKIATLVLIAGLLVGGWYYIQSWEFNLFGLSFGGELKIENTANVVEKIKEISEFTTACYYEEAVLKDSKVEKNESGFLGLIDMETSKEIVIIAKGKVRAGFDLSKVTEDKINIKNDTIGITLPELEIFVKYVLAAHERPRFF